MNIEVETHQTPAALMQEFVQRAISTQEWMEKR